MRTVIVIALVLAFLIVGDVTARVDTLSDTSEVRDCVVYSYENCNSDVEGEDCRRYNGGGVTNMGVGSSGPSRSRRVLMQFPGWNGVMPDSSDVKVFCINENDSLDRRVFLYPLTSRFFEGSEAAYTVGDYPETDSGATWLHSWLDVGDGDSALWSSPGGDYTTAVACTAVFATLQIYQTFSHFNRILNYWDTSGSSHGIVLINENAFPANMAAKVIKSSESSPEYAPLLVLYYPDTLMVTRRRRLIIAPNLMQRM